MNGYVKLYRSLLDWEWYDDPAVFRLWIHLLLRANFTPGSWHGVAFERGELIASVPSLSAQTGLTQKQVRTALGKLKRTGEILARGGAGHTLITLSHWDRFQREGGPDGPGSAGEGPPPGAAGASEGRQSKKERRQKRKKETREREDAFFSPEAARGGTEEVFSPPGTAGGISSGAVPAGFFPSEPLFREPEPSSPAPDGAAFFAVSGGSQDPNSLSPVPGEPEPFPPAAPDGAASFAVSGGSQGPRSLSPAPGGMEIPGASLPDGAVLKKVLPAGEAGRGCSRIPAEASALPAPLPCRRPPSTAPALRDSGRLRNSRSASAQDMPPACSGSGGETAAPLEAALEQFRQFRREAGRPLTRRGEELLREKLLRLAEGDETRQAAILEQSVVNGWNGVFPLRDSPARGREGNPFLALLGEESL